MGRRVPGFGVVLGVFAGLAVGEAVGLRYVLSGEPPPGPGGLEPLWVGGRAAYGGVTESALVLGEVLVGECGFNPLRFVERLASVADLENPVRLYSPATVEVLSRVRRGVSWLAAREGVSSTEPPVDVVARGAPVALFYTKERVVGEMAAAQALATSLERDAVEAARLYGLMLHYLLEGLPLVEAAEEAARQTPRRHLGDAVLAAVELASAGAPPGTASGVLEVAAAPPARVVAAAVYASLTASSPGDALWRAILAGGPVAGAAAASAAGVFEALRSPETPPSGLWGSVLPVERLEVWGWVEKTSRLLAAGARRCHGLTVAWDEEL